MGRLLGNHAAHGGFLPSLTPDFVREVRSVDARWPLDGSGNCGDGPLVRETVECVRARKRAVCVVRNAIRDVAPRLRYRARSREPGQETLPHLLPYRTGVDRRASVYELLGAEPMGFRAQSLAPSSRAVEPVHIYLDVSGSTAEVLPFLYAALKPLLPIIHENVHLFSTVVRDIRPEGIRRGIAETTGGTNLDCVLQHILNHRIRRSVVITDGLVEMVPKEHKSALRDLGARVNSVVTVPGETEFAEGIPGRLFLLPELVDG